jgi:DNA-binding transcriptional ArsR family regulator
MSFNDFTSLYKRAERLSSAVFLVSNTIIDSNELRAKIRSLALSLVEQSAAIKDRAVEEKLRIVSRIESILIEMASLMDIASISSLISPMNASILKQEFDLLTKDLDELRSYCNGKSEISQDFFHENDQISVAPTLSIQSENQKILKGDEVAKKGRNSRKEHREKAIIELLRVRGNVNIKDISKAIKGCSEKTIQRKLISLIKVGIVKKEGERRWSRYSLVTV